MKTIIIGPTVLCSVFVIVNKIERIKGPVVRTGTYRIADNEIMISDSKSCLSGLNWPRSEKTVTFGTFWLVEGTLGIGWK